MASFDSLFMLLLLTELTAASSVSWLSSRSATDRASSTKAHLKSQTGQRDDFLEIATNKLNGLIHDLELQSNPEKKIQHPRD